MSFLAKTYIKEADFLFYSFVVVWEYWCLVALNISISYLLYCTITLRYRADSIVLKDRKETAHHFTCYNNGGDHNYVKDTPAWYFQFYPSRLKAGRTTLEAYNCHTMLMSGKLLCFNSYLLSTVQKNHEFLNSSNFLLLLWCLPCIIWFVNLPEHFPPNLKLMVSMNWTTISITVEFIKVYFM